jgi:adenine-specific DNA glycosylase
MDVTRKERAYCSLCPLSNQGHEAKTREKRRHDGKDGKLKGSHLLELTRNELNDRYEEEGPPEQGLQDGTGVTAVIEGAANSNSYGDANNIHRGIDKREDVEHFASIFTDQIGFYRKLPRS